MMVANVMLKSLRPLHFDNIDPGPTGPWTPQTPTPDPGHVCMMHISMMRTEFHGQTDKAILGVGFSSKKSHASLTSSSACPPFCFLESARSLTLASYSSTVLAERNLYENPRRWLSLKLFSPAFYGEGKNHHCPVEPLQFLSCR